MGISVSMAAWRRIVVVIFQLCCFSCVVGYMIERVPGCASTWSLEECPEHLPTLLAPPDVDHAVPEGVPRMEFGELPDTQMVGNLTVYMKVHDYSGYVVKLILSTDNEQHDVRCLTVPADRDTSAVTINCIRMVKDPSTLLTVQIFEVRRNPCKCDVTTGCGRLCSTVISAHTKPTTFQIGKEACLYWKKEHQHPPVSLNLSVSSRPKQMASFKVYAGNMNPYASLAVSIHADHVFNVKPVCEKPMSEQITRTVVLMDELCDLHKFREHQFFYAKVSMYCPGDEYPYAEHTSTRSQLLDRPDIRPNLKSSRNPTVVPPGDDEGADVDDDVLLYGVLAGLVVVAILLTTVVWHGVKRCRSRQRPERYPSVEYSDTERPKVSLLTSTQSTPDSTIVYSREERPRSVMILSHPDSEVHEQALKTFIHCLERHAYTVVGQVKDCSQNWLDLADGAGIKFHDVIVVMSQGLYDLCKEYKIKESKENGRSTTDRWNELLQKRNGEFLPCVALDALRTCYFHHRTAFRVHFVSFVYENRSSECDMFPDLVNEFIAANSLFLTHGNNTFEYVLPMTEFQTEANSNTSDNNVRPGMSRLLHNLSYFSELDEQTV